MTLAPCPTHGSTYRALHEHNFRGIVEVIDNIILTISGVVGTTSYSRCPVGYPWNFEGVVRALEDLNTTVSGIQGGGGSAIAAGSGIYTTTSGSVTLINSAIVGGSGVYITYSGNYIEVNSTVSSASGILYTAGSGIYLSDGDTRINVNYPAVLQESAGSGLYLTNGGLTLNTDPAFVLQNAAGSGLYLTNSGLTLNTDPVFVLQNSAGSGLYLTNNGLTLNTDYDNIFQNSISGHLIPEGSVSITYSGNSAIISGTSAGGGGGASITVSGEPAAGYSTGSLWFDTSEGRLFVYASGNGIAEPAWYQTNAEAIAIKGEEPPSGLGLNAPPRDGSIWFNTLLGSLFVYDATTSGWYETGPTRSFAYSAASPAPSAQGAGWYDTANSQLRVWNGSTWIQV